jgi:glutathione synthase/RimK-type ligase-like ATP-grasp enzyme
MKILFCESSISPNNVDEAFIEEYKCAKKYGFDVLLYNFEETSLRKTKPNNKMEIIIYRGWMINPIEYKNLYENLLSKNYMLINNPTEYQNCHYLPDSLKFIEKYTPKTVFQKMDNKNSLDVLIEKSKVFNGKPVIVKDYVKSEKHYWDTACFVPNSNDVNKLTEIINNLIELRENYLNEGIVIREYIELFNLTKHSKSGMPLSEEYRLFFYKNELLCIYNYWEECDYNINQPKTKIFEKIAKEIESNFFTMDIAKDKNGNYIIIELGDGQVAGIPEREDKNIFYKRIKGRQNGT